MTINGALIALKVVAQDLLHELHAVVHAAGMTGERGEELELGCGEVDLFALNQNLVPRDIDDQIAKVENLDLRLVGKVSAAEQGTHARHELARGEGFDEVVVRTELETDDTILNLPLSGKHDNRHIRGVTDGTAHTLAGKLGKHKVEHDQVKLVLLELLNGGLTVANTHDPITLTLKIGCHRVADGLFILNQQNLTCI